MRVHILSDLHLEFASFEPNDVEADVASHVPIARLPPSHFASGM